LQEIIYTCVKILPVYIQLNNMQTKRRKRAEKKHTALIVNICIQWQTSAGFGGMEKGQPLPVLSSHNSSPNFCLTACRTARLDTLVSNVSSGIETWRDEPSGNWANMRDPDVSIASFSRLLKMHLFQHIGRHCVIMRGYYINWQLTPNAIVNSRIPHRAVHASHLSTLRANIYNRRPIRICRARGNSDTASHVIHTDGQGNNKLEPSLVTTASSIWETNSIVGRRRSLVGGLSLTYALTTLRVNCPLRVCLPAHSAFRPSRVGKLVVINMD